jgi:metacaspase-1
MSKKALLVGINDYAPIGASDIDLRGCVNDVKDMAHTLNTLGVVQSEPASMRIITDARATKSNILSGIKWLIKGAKKGDNLIFYYSGHGSQVVDLDGDELDKKDETLCPHDFRTSGMITDDELRKVLCTLPQGVKLSVILDSCHSGTGTRELNLQQSIGNNINYRYIEPPIDFSYFLDANPSLPVEGMLKNSSCKDNDNKINHILWAACKDNQTSAEALVDGEYRGVFTYCFCKILRRANGNIENKKLLSLLSIDLKKMGFLQTPQFESDKKELNSVIWS